LPLKKKEKNQEKILSISIDTSRLCHINRKASGSRCRTLGFETGIFSLTCFAGVISHVNILNGLMENNNRFLRGEKDHDTAFEYS
jgi:hypothetical protein